MNKEPKSSNELNDFMKSLRFWKKDKCWAKRTDWGMVEIAKASGGVPDFNEMGVPVVSKLVANGKEQFVVQWPQFRDACQAILDGKLG
jgi:hypothetical protein